MNFIDTAKQYVDAGYSVIPITENKIPSIGRWGIYQVAPMPHSDIEKYFKDCYGIALLTGKLSGTVAIDIDTKYFLDDNLYDKIKEAVPNSILRKLFVQTTKNGGYHWVFKVDKDLIGGNKKLANRHTTAYERDKVYRDAFSCPKTRDKATKIAHNHKSLVLIETREEGGYVVITPTRGYQKVFGKISRLEREEYEQLIEILRSFNEVKDLQQDKKSHSDIEWKVNPIDHYNSEGDVVQTLVNNGWEIVEESNRNVRFKRPGQTYSSSSALFDKDRRIFNCFSTSSEFDTGKGYSCFGVYALLEHDNDFSSAFHALINLNYGEKEK